ncbi:MAG TPA: class I SAM-dependent methyltransferase [Blastocatellia bacterium]|nr:class I SAM-dependent methyltransferase [Blastocatellia bacterium]
MTLWRNPAAMGFYSTHVFPRVLDWSLSDATVEEQRRAALAPLRGRVLEVGFGTGLNLACYPNTVTRLTAIDSVRMLPDRVAKRISEAHMPIELFLLDASGTLPFEDRSFDGVVTTFTLCSIRDVLSALAEIRRVLKPDHPFAFLEHGRSDDPRVIKWQDRLNPIQRVVACGCNLNRPIESLIRRSGFEIVKIERYLMPGVPRIFAEMYRGLARPAEGLAQ